MTHKKTPYLFATIAVIFLSGFFAVPGKADAGCRVVYTPSYIPYVYKIEPPPYPFDMSIPFNLTVTGCEQFVDMEFSSNASIYGFDYLWVDIDGDGKKEKVAKSNLTSNQFDALQQALSNLYMALPGMYNPPGSSSLRSLDTLSWGGSISNGSINSALSHGSQYGCNGPGLAEVGGACLDYFIRLSKITQGRYAIPIGSGFSANYVCPDGTKIPFSGSTNTVACVISGELGYDVDCTGVWYDEDPINGDARSCPDGSTVEPPVIIVSSPDPIPAPSPDTSASVDLMANGQGKNGPPDDPVQPIAYNTAANLTWVSEGTVKCYGYGFNTGGATQKGYPGVASSPLTADTTFLISCTTTNGGFVTDTVTVPVNGLFPPENFNAVPASCGTSPSRINLSWTAPPGSEGLNMKYWIKRFNETSGGSVWIGNGDPNTPPVSGNLSSYTYSDPSPYDEINNPLKSGDIYRYEMYAVYPYTYNPTSGWVVSTAVRAPATVCDGAMRPDLVPTDLKPYNTPVITGTTYTETDANGEPQTYFVPGTTITLSAKPKNLGPGAVADGSRFFVKFQRSYIDMSGYWTVPSDIINNFAEVDSPLASGATVLSPVSISDSSSGTAASTVPGAVTFYAFTYCVDLPQTVINPNVVGNINETQGGDDENNGVGEFNNCSLPTTILFRYPSTGFDYTLANDGNKAVERGASVNSAISANLVAPPTRPVSLSASVRHSSGTLIGNIEPSIGTAFTPLKGSPTFGSTLSLSTSNTTPAEVYKVKVTGTPDPIIGGSCLTEFADQGRISGGVIGGTIIHCASNPEGYYPVSEKVLAYGTLNITDWTGADEVYRAFANGACGANNWTTSSWVTGTNSSSETGVSTPITSWQLNATKTFACTDQSRTKVPIKITTFLLTVTGPPQINFIDIGLRVNQGTPTNPDIQHIAIENPIALPTPPSSLMIAEDGVAYHVALVPVTDVNATKARTTLANGTVMAFRSCTPTNNCDFVP